MIAFLIAGEYYSRTMHEQYSSGQPDNHDAVFADSLKPHELSPLAQAVHHFDNHRQAVYDHTIAMIQGRLPHFETAKDELYSKVMWAAESFSQAGQAAIAESQSLPEAAQLIATLYSNDEDERLDLLTRHYPQATYRRVGSDNAQTMFEFYLDEPELGATALKDRYAVDVAHNLRSCLHEPLYSEDELRQRHENLAAMRRRLRMRELGRACLTAGVFSASLLMSYKFLRRHT